MATAACGPPITPPRHSDPAEPLPPVDELIAVQENRYDADVGLYAVNLNSGRTLAHRDDHLFAVCSTFKAYLAARVLDGDQQGRLALTDRILVDPAELKPHSPVTEPAAGQRISVLRLCEATLQQSDNTAANLLLALIGGPPEITAFARVIGDERTRLDRWETELNSARPGDPRDTSTPRALGQPWLLAG